MQQTFMIPLQAQAKCELKLKSQRIPMLKANDICMILIT